MVAMFGCHAHSGGGAGAGFQIACISDEKEEMILDAGGGGGGGFSSPGHLTGLRSFFGVHVLQHVTSTLFV